MTSIEFWIPGWPATKGSVVVQSGRHIAQSPASDAWAEIVRRSAADAIAKRGWRTIRRPAAVSVRTAYFLPTPVGQDMRVSPVVDHDGDKLDRNVWDALTRAQIWEDDAQVARWLGTRHWCGPIAPGAYVSVATVRDHQVVLYRGDALELASRARHEALGDLTEPTPAGF